MTAAPSHVRAPRPLNTSLPQHESLVHMLLSAVDAQPNLPAVILEQQRITYAELGRAVAGLAQAAWRRPAPSAASASSC